MGICTFDTLYSKAYLRHLFVAGEMLGPQLASIHNLAFYQWLMKEARKNIVKGTFIAWKEKAIRQFMQRL